MGQGNVLGKGQHTLINTLGHVSFAHGRGATPKPWPYLTAMALSTPFPTVSHA